MRPRSNWLLIFILVLGLFSVLTLRGISVTYATNQLFFFIIGIIVFWLLSSVSFGYWERTKWLWYSAVVGLLVLTLIIGNVTKGAVSWLSIGSYRLQPSEFVKPALLLLLASSVPLGSLKRNTNYVIFGVISFIPMILILLQPDLGTLLTIIGGVSVQFLLHRPSKKAVTVIIMMALLIALSGWLFWLQDYQKDRIQTFWQPQTDLQGSGYNARQAMIAVGSGGATGLGWGEGRQSHLRFLPEQHTDFLFATFAEERGFVGAIILILIYSGLFTTLVWYLRQLQHSTAWTFTASATGLLLLQTFVNIGMNMGLTPVTGIPLPLFSLGGSSLLSTTIILGWIESARRSELKMPQQTEKIT